MKRILCYGDSNTWGDNPETSGERYTESERWPTVLGAKLGNEYEIIEEGLCARTLCTLDPREGYEKTNGYKYFMPTMEKHDKFDILILMLGTNEYKFEENTPQDILNMLIKFIDTIKAFKSKKDGTTPLLIICGCAPYMDTKRGVPFEKSVKVNDLYREYCLQNIIPFVDNADLATGKDGVHFSLSAHLKLADKLYNVVKFL